MSIGLVLEGGAMRGLYTAGVLDVFLDNNIKVDGIIDFWATVTNIETGEAEYLKLDSVLNQMEILRATSAMPLVSK